MLDVRSNNFSKEISNFKDFFTVAYCIIDDIYHKVTPAHIKNRRNIKDSKMSDSEIITISVVGELFTIDSEKSWVSFCKKNFSDLFPIFCDRTRFNRTRRNLHSVIDLIQKQFTHFLGYANQVFRVVDSMPISVCKFGRAAFHKTYRGHATYGRCASKKETYLGFKLHLMTALDGFVTDYVLTSANVDDRSAIWELVASYQSITILADKGYTNTSLSPELKRLKNINLIPLKRDKSKTQYPKEFRQLVFRFRRNIETTASKLNNQLNIERVLSRSMLGFIARIRTKLLAYNLSYYINKLLGIADISRIKHLIFG